MHAPDPAQIATIAGLLRGARSALVITGAGMSADSGLPTYRGVGGLYDREVTDEGVPIEVALSGTMMSSRPALTWKYIHQIEQACRGARPNPGHRVLAELEQAMDRLWVLTQNVDGFHRAAGSRNVIEIHGNIHRLLCPRCAWDEQVSDYAHLATVPPPCPRCDAIVRPDVVLFGELLSPAPVVTLERELARGFDLVLSVGTTSVFPYISEPVLAARRAGVPTVEINPGESEISHLVEYRVQASARAALEAIWDAYRAG
jgi:NAD-dependent deacetylase